MPNKTTKEEFINKALLVHGDKYDYSKVEYINNRTKVCIICPLHGEFWVVPESHLRGTNCPMCGEITRRKNKTSNIEEWINKAKAVYGDKYDYSKSVYNGALSPITIICPKHGEFTQRTADHLSGYGCTKCGYETVSESLKSNIEEFIENARLVHGDKYDYSKVEYNTNKIDVCIICPEHGEYYQQPNNHLNGHGCPICANISNGINKLKTLDSFISECILVHDDKYDYSKVDYTGNKEKVCIICPKHGEFWQRPNDHLNGHGCPKCTNTKSKWECDICEFLTINNINFIQSDRTILKGLELDIYVPSLNIAIECDGLYWHSEIHKDKNYHLNKTIACEKEGIQLIHIFEDEWMFKRDIVESRLLNLFGKNTDNRIFARKCEIREVNNDDSKNFLSENHIQGYCVSPIRYGLYHGGELVSLMTFSSLRKNLGREAKDGSFEMIRFCSKKNMSIIGGASKLFNYFINNNNVKNIITFADKRWSQGKLYVSLGFKLHHASDPSYFYIIDKHRENRYKYRKDILISKFGCLEDTTEHAFCSSNGWHRIYDCGALVFEYNI